MTKPTHQATQPAKVRFVFGRLDLHEERFTNQGAAIFGAGKPSPRGFRFKGASGAPFSFAKHPAASDAPRSKTGIGFGKPRACASLGMFTAQGSGNPIFIDFNNAVFSSFSELDTSGYGTRRVTDSGTPTLTGSTRFGQWVVRDSTIPSHLAATDGAIPVL